MEVSLFGLHSEVHLSLKKSRKEEEEEEKQEMKNNNPKMMKICYQMLKLSNEENPSPTQMKTFSDLLNQLDGMANVPAEAYFFALQSTIKIMEKRTTLDVPKTTFEEYNYDDLHYSANWIAMRRCADFEHLVFDERKKRKREDVEENEVAVKKMKS